MKMGMSRKILILMMTSAWLMSLAMLEEEVTATQHQERMTVSHAAVLFSLPFLIIVDDGLNQDVVLSIEASDVHPQTQVSVFCTEHNLPVEHCVMIRDMVRKRTDQLASIEHNNQQVRNSVPHKQRQTSTSTSKGGIDDSDETMTVGVETDTEQQHQHHQQPPPSQQQQPQQSEAEAADRSQTQPSEPLYSSFHCTSGNQDFKDWASPQRGNVSFGAHRVCLLENICFKNGWFVYHQHPEEARAPQYLQLMKLEALDLHLSIASHNAFSFTVTESPLPDDVVPLIDPHTWAFSLATKGFNFAHLLTDDLFPVMAAMDMFDLPIDTARLLYVGCANIGDISYQSPARTGEQACDDNYRTFGKLMFGEEPRRAEEWSNGQFCMKRFIVGQGGVFGALDNNPDKHMGKTLRRGRDIFVRNLEQQMPRPVRLKVVLIPKIMAGHTADMILGAGLCDSVTRVIQSIANVDVQCVGLGLGVEERINIIRTATLIIAEHGTVANLGLLAHDGTVQIVIGRKEFLKDAHTFVYATHVKFLFTTLDAPAELPGLIRYGLHLAAKNFNVSLQDYLI